MWYVPNSGGGYGRKRRQKSVLLKPQSVEEAILQMNLLGHQFYLFLNEEHVDVNVVYKRSDGGYGIIEPEF